ncbi:MAG TPA: glycoside hydrolase family 3 N-terminal domain-containing protein, partial [Anaerolineaceae bacterium]|nr:glycoside hydrolase family 3 N-terminal domain-containing protein [Anaerolineaceae bacterium]
MKTLGIIGRIVLALGMCLSLPASRGQAQPYLQTDDPQAKAEALLAEMTPEERVGQLFLVTFDGNQFDSTSAISSLISRYHVGGVVLTAANDNFVDGDGTVSAAHHLTESLQRIEWDITHPSGSESDPAQPASGAYIPLLIGVSQNGDGYPNDQILDGLTPLPSLMSIGATWQTALAERVGRTLGRELEALGINLLLGPSLDVLDPQYGGDGGGLGANTFGSDPYWTQELGKEYISGIHVGGQGRLAVVAKHFPGQGGSDRNPETEVATVRKSLEQLKQIELAPFLAVTSNPQNTSTIADGFLVSHIRYQGFQGNIRETTRPVSLDKSAVDELMALPEFLNWHQSGGVLISDNLGSQSVRRFYDTIGQAFDSRLVARDAFLAGNDLLYVDDFISGTDPDSFTSITKTLDYFTTKYRDDPAFAQRVDDSVRRILTLKYRLYPSFEIDQVLPDEKNLGFIKNSNDVTLDVARNAVTLISPTTASDLESLIAAPPSSSDRILFITDTLTGVQCSTCMTSSGLTVDALQSAVLRLYGPGAGGQVNEGRLVSYSFEDLINVLNYVESPTNEPYPLESDLQRAQWVIFSALNETNDRPASQA